MGKYRIDLMNKHVWHLIHKQTAKAENVCMPNVQNKKENGRRIKKTIIASTEADQIDFKLRNMSMNYLDRVLYSHKVSICKHF